MFKKILWLVGITIVLLFLANQIINRFVSTTITPETPIIGKLTCPYAVKISGDSMAPVLNSGETKIFSRCFDANQDLNIGSVVMFKNRDVLKISRITAINLELPAKYKTTPDNRPKDFIDISANQIIAILK